MKIKGLTFYSKTGFIKNEDGFTLVETLVATIILLLIVTIMSSTLSSLFSSPKVFKLNAAFFAAKQEMDLTLAQKLVSDSVYSLARPHIFVERRVRAGEKVYQVKVVVTSDTIGTKLVELSGMFYK